MIALPLGQATIGQAVQASQLWCWTDAHQQEAAQRYAAAERYGQGGGRPLIAHLHHHGQDCNERCQIFLRQPVAEVSKEGSEL